ncbi:hypothetical protein BDR05DRAFT_48310 [Suillus weaverae]|nr:hypothetical protein BDR05DRAFT_48310 [Suillus weaverae]
MRMSKISPASPSISVCFFGPKSILLQIPRNFGGRLEEGSVDESRKICHVPVQQAGYECEHVRVLALGLAFYSLLLFYESSHLIPHPSPSDLADSFSRRL